MPKDVTERRERTHDLHIIQGLSREETVEQVTSEFDAGERTVRDDLRNLTEWVGELIQTDPTGESRIRELREARGRLYHLALDARENGNTDLERKIVSDIVAAIATDIELCQSLGLTVDAQQPGEIPLPEDIDADDPLASLGDRDPAILLPSR